MPRLMARDGASATRTGSRPEPVPRAVAYAGAHPWPTALGIVAALYVVGLGLLTPRFEANDDTAMMFVVSGISYGEPSPHLPFSNVLILQVLRLLYTAAPDLPWYGLYLYTLQALALVVIVGSLLVLTRPLSTARLLLVAVAVAAVPPTLVVQLQFTSTAILLGLAGVVLHLALLREGSRPGWAAHAAAGMLLGGASLVRWSGFQAALVVGLPLLVAHLRWDRRRVLRALAFLATALVVAFGASAVESRVYEDRPEWQEYFAYNSVRGSLHDNPRLRPYEELRDVYGEIGWSENDLLMFRTWFFADPDLYSRPALERIVEAAPPGSRRPLGLGEGLLTLWSSWRVPLAALLGVAVASTLLAPRRRWWAPGGYALYVTAVLLLLLFYVRLPDRVALPLLFGGIVGTVVLGRLAASAGAEPSASNRARAASLVCVAGLLVAATGLAALVRQSEHNRALQESMDVRVQQLRDLGPDAVYVSWGGALHLSHLHPLRPRSDELRALTWVGLGWRVHSPSFDRHVAELGLGDLYLDIALRDDVLLAARPNHVTLFERYLEEHYGLTGSMEPVADLHGVPITVYGTLQDG